MLAGSWIALGRAGEVDFSTVHIYTKEPGVSVVSGTDGHLLIHIEMVHPVLVPLDGQGRASFRLPGTPPPGLSFPDIPGLQAAFITLDPTSPDGIGAISNAEPLWEDSR